MKELVAVRRGIATFADDLRGRVVTLWEDNQAVVFIIRNKQPGIGARFGHAKMLALVLKAQNLSCLGFLVSSQ